MRNRQSFYSANETVFTLDPTEGTGKRKRKKCIHYDYVNDFTYVEKSTRSVKITVANTQNFTVSQGLGAINSKIRHHFRGILVLKNSKVSFVEPYRLTTDDGKSVLDLLNEKIRCARSYGHRKKQKTGPAPTTLVSILPKPEITPRPQTVVIRDNLYPSYTPQTMPSMQPSLNQETRLAAHPSYLEFLWAPLSEQEKVTSYAAQSNIPRQLPMSCPERNSASDNDCDAKIDQVIQNLRHASDNNGQGQIDLVIQNLHQAAEKLEDQATKLKAAENQLLMMKYSRDRLFPAAHHMAQNGLTPDRSSQTEETRLAYQRPSGRFSGGK